MVGIIISFEETGSETLSTIFCKVVKEKPWCEKIYKEEAASVASHPCLTLPEKWLGNETATQCNQGISNIWRPMSSESNKVACRVSNPWRLLINCERSTQGFSHCRDFNDSFSGQSLFPGERFNVSCLKGSVSYTSEGMSVHMISDFIFKCEGQWHSWPKLELSHPWSALLAA